LFYFTRSMMFALQSLGWTLQQALRFVTLTVKTPCGQTVGGLNAALIKSL